MESNNDPKIVGRGFSPAPTLSGMNPRPTEESGTGSIEERVEKLEKDAGQWRRIAMRLYGVALALGAMPILMFALAAIKPAAVPDVLRAKKLEIVDDKGKVRVDLTVLAGVPFLALSDEKGKARAELAVFADGPDLVLSDEKGEPRATLAMAAGGPFLALFDKDGETRAGLMVTALGPALALYDEKGKVRATLAALAGVPGLVLRDEKGMTRAWLGASADGPDLTLSDADGKARLVLGHTQLKTVKTSEGTIRAESSVVLFDKDGTVIWKAPPG